jgi:hypothetical protein
MRRMTFPAIALLAFGLAAGRPVAAQRVTFVGLVVDSATGAPVSGATLRIGEQDLVATTDIRGQFVLPEVPAGVLELLVQRLGYRAGAMQLELTVERAVRIDLGVIFLTPVTTELDTVEVVGDELNPKLASVGFYHRMRSEKGRFFTQEDIEAINPANTSEVFKRIPGFRVLRNGSIASARGIPSLRRGFDLCEVVYYIDGVHASAPDVDVVIPSSISGIEVYTGASTIPPLFRGTGNPKCGVVAIWTREGKRPSGER